MGLGVSRKGEFCGALAAAFVGACATPALAQGGEPGASPANLRDALFGSFRRDERNGRLPMVARYRSDNGESFVLDRTSGGATLLRFSSDPEIWVLKPTAGPRGDIIYRDDLGQPVLRAMRVGGLTLFTPNRPDGMAAALGGSAPVLRQSFVATPQQLLQVLVQASARASRAAQHLIAFEAPDYTPGTEPVFADAAALAAEAFVRVASAGRPGRDVVARYVKVRFDAGRAPGAMVVGREVRITLSPRDGLAGRPSSRKIATALASR